MSTHDGCMTGKSVEMMLVLLTHGCTTQRRARSGRARWIHSEQKRYEMLWRVTSMDTTKYMMDA
jgi:hypothetical protein